MVHQYIGLLYLVCLVSQMANEYAIQPSWSSDLGHAADRDIGADMF
jgi:hypothetical protein